MASGGGVYKGERICKMKVLRLKLILSVRTLCTQLFCYFPGRKTLPTNVVSACISLSLSLCLPISVSVSISVAVCLCVCERAGCKWRREFTSWHNFRAFVRII